MRLRAVCWVGLWVFMCSGMAHAEQVREYVDPETGILVFDASEGNTDFVVPQQPREFANVDEYMKWVKERFHGYEVLDEKGDVVDVRGAWTLIGRPTYEMEGRVFTVRNPMVQTIAGPFGFVVIGGEKYEIPTDEEPPPYEEVEPAFHYGIINYGRSCVGGFLGGIGYCGVGAVFKHINILYQSVGGTFDLDLSSSAAVTPSTTVTMTLGFRDFSGNLLRIVTPTTRQGVQTVRGFGVGGISFAEWGVFGNPYVDPTKTMTNDSVGSGPNKTGGSGRVVLSMIRRFP